MNKLDNFFDLPHNIRFSLSLILLVLTMSLSAQAWSLADIEIKKLNGDEFKHDFTGGLNSGQFFNLDFNLDGIEDLIIFDRSGARYLPFLRNDVDCSLTYAPEYSHNFPETIEWVIFKDFDGDDIPDMFTYAKEVNGGAMLFRGKREANHLAFDEVVLKQPFFNVLSQFFNGNYSNITIDRRDFPAIEDVNGDGDLDILSFDTDGASLYYYESQQVEDDLKGDSLYFKYVTKCFGRFFESDFSNEILLSPNMNDCAKPNPINDPVASDRHSGSTVTLIDANHDGLKDVLLGDLSSNRIVYLQNGGTVESNWFTSQDIEFPAYNVSIDLPEFLATFHLDMDCDGKKDLIVAPNETVSSAKTDNVLFYKNVGTNNDTFVFQSDHFLVDQMVDFGQKTVPSLVDLNADGFLDLVVGLEIDRSRTNPYNGMVSLLHNGDVINPSFRIENLDYLNFSQYTSISYAFAPTWHDMDGDGDMDLLVGDDRGKIFYGENTAGAGNGVEITFVTPEWMDIDVGSYAVPSVGDLNEDGLPDLVIGERLSNNVDGKRCGNINYYQNIGSLSNPQFDSDVKTSPNNNCLGKISVADFAGYGYAAPTLYDTGDSLMFYIGQIDGTIEKRVIGGLQDSFIVYNEHVGRIDAGIYSALVFGDLDNDGILELVVGNQGGGIMIYKTPLDVNGQNVHTSNVESKSNLNLFPNPVRSNASIQVPKLKGKLTMRSMSGQVVYQQTVEDTESSILAPEKSGSYIVSLVNQQHVYSALLIVID